MTANAEPPHSSAADLPSIAVVIPCHNAERWVGEAIESVLRQSYPRLELIVVDDGSSDGSAKVAGVFGARVSLLTGPNRGACHARNRAMAAATSEFVLFLDADDFLAGDYLAQLAACAGPGVDVVVGGHAWADSEGRLGQTRVYRDVSDPASLLVAYLRGPIQTSGFLWRRQALIDAGGWLPSLPFYQDIELGLRMLLRLRPFAIAPLTGAIAGWRVHDGPRVSTNMSVAKIDAVAQALASHEPALTALGEPRAERALAQMYYNLASTAFACNCTPAGHRALARARALGLRGHPGTLAHRLSSRLLGLEPKMRLSAALYQLRGDRPRHQRPYPFNVVAG